MDFLYLMFHNTKYAPILAKISKMAQYKIRTSPTDPFYPILLRINIRQLGQQMHT